MSDKTVKIGITVAVITLIGFFAYQWWQLEKMKKEIKELLKKNTEYDGDKLSKI